MRHRDLLIVGLFCVGLGSGCARTQAKPADMKPDEVLVSHPTVDEVTDFEEFIGHTDPIFSVDVRARVNGYLDQVNFKDGDEVEKGAVLFTIDARPYQSTFDQTVASVEQGNARLTRTSADQRRAEALLKRNSIGLEEYDRIHGDFAEAKAAIGAAKAMLDMAQLNLDWTKVIAPISGRLSRRLVDPGNLIKADDTLLVNIVSLDPMYVTFDLDERVLLRLRRLIAEGRMQSRQEAEVPILVALSDEPDFPHKGTISFSDNRIDSSTGTLRLRGLIPNPKPRLLSPGMFVRVRLPVGKPHRSVLVAEEAIGTDQGRKFVYVVTKGKVKSKDKATGKEVEREADLIAYRPIKVGSLSKGLRVIDSGLSTDERVVVSGLQRVRQGKEVTPRFLDDLNKKADSSPATPKAATPATIAVNGSPTGPSSPTAPTPSH